MFEPRELDWIAEAPETYVFEAALRSPRPEVFAAISSDPSTWTWFPGLKNASYVSDAPHGVGSVRQVTIGGTYYRETILAWDEPSRWAYRVDESSAPIGRSLLEDWVMTDDRGGTVVRWTFTIDPTFVFRLGRPLAPWLMGGLFRKAMKNLDAQLQAAGRDASGVGDGARVGA